MHRRLKLLLGLLIGSCWLAAHAQIRPSFSIVNDQLRPGQETAELWLQASYSLPDVVGISMGVVWDRASLRLTNARLSPEMEALSPQILNLISGSMTLTDPGGTREVGFIEPVVIRKIQSLLGGPDSFLPAGENLNIFKLVFAVDTTKVHPGDEFPVEFRTLTESAPRALTNSLFQFQGETRSLAVDDLNPGAIEVIGYTRGDVNLSGVVDTTDAIMILRALFLGYTLASPAHADVNASGRIDVTDVVHLMSYLFVGGTPPAAPFPEPFFSADDIEVVVPPPDVIPPPDEPQCHTSFMRRWQNLALANGPFSGTLKVEFEATPLAPNIDAVMGVSLGTVNPVERFVDGYRSLAAIVRFSDEGVIEAINDTDEASSPNYEADVTLAYQPSVRYVFVMDIRINHETRPQTFSVDVIPGGHPNTPIRLATDYEFRLQQKGVAQLSNFAFSSGNANGDVVICNLGGFETVSGPDLPPPPIEPPNTDDDEPFDLDLPAFERVGAFALSIPPPPPVPTTNNVFYVDPVRGSMANPGTQTAPWSTIQEVIAAGKIGSVVRSGDTILLRDGEHGNITLVEHYNSEMITIAAEPGHQPKLGRIVIAGGRNWRVQNLTVRSKGGSKDPDQEIRGYPALVSIEGTQNVELIGNTIYSKHITQASSARTWRANVCNGIYLRSRGGVKVENALVSHNHIYHVSHGVNAAGNNIRVRYNIIHRIGGDGIPTGAVDSEIVGNILANFFDLADGNHDDGIQFHKGSGPCYDCSNVLISGNVILGSTVPPPAYAVASSKPQGIGLFQGGYEDFTIVNNLVYGGHASHGISVYGGKNFFIANNTVFGTHPDHDSPIRLATSDKVDPDIGEVVPFPSVDNTVVNNIARGYSLSGGNTVSNNLEISIDPSNVFVDWRRNDFRLRAGSPAINRGTSGGPTVDILGHPVTGTPDVGAYQYSQ